MSHCLCLFDLSELFLNEPGLGRAGWNIQRSSSLNERRGQQTYRDRDGRRCLSQDSAGPAVSRSVHSSVWSWRGSRRSPAWFTHSPEEKQEGKETSVIRGLTPAQRGLVIRLRCMGVVKALKYHWSGRDIDSFTVTLPNSKQTTTSHSSPQAEVLFLLGILHYLTC